jgi:hypothetical protein
MISGEDKAPGGRSSQDRQARQIGDVFYALHFRSDEGGDVVSDLLEILQQSIGFRYIGQELSADIERK